MTVDLFFFVSALASRIICGLWKMAHLVLSPVDLEHGYIAIAVDFIAGWMPGFAFHLYDQRLTNGRYTRTETVKYRKMKTHPMPSRDKTTLHIFQAKFTQP